MPTDTDQLDSIQKPRSNLVSFTPEDNAGQSPSDGSPASPMIFLTLEGPFVLSATSSQGLEPNINRAIVPYTQWDKYPRLPGALGTVKFWSHWDKTDKLPGPTDAPDHQIANVRVVDVEALTIGEVSGLPGARIIEYRIYLADLRERWVEPFGGRLASGIVNPEPLPKDGVLKSNSELMLECLGAMGQLLAAPLPDGIDLLPPPRDLKWFGNHAPTELRQLLEWTQTVMCLQPGGLVKIYNPGMGELPKIPAGELTFDLEIPSVNRRGEAVILTSYPNTTIQTIEIHGPSPLTWEFVMRNSEGQWVPIRDVVHDPVYTVRENFQNLLHTGDLYGRAMVELYRYIRLNPIIYENHVMRRLMGDNKSIGTPQFKALVYRVGESGQWENSPAHTEIFPQYLIDGHIFGFYHRLGKIAPGGTNPFNAFEELARGDLIGTVSLEVYKDGKPEYFSVGFRKEAAPDMGTGGLVQMSDSEVQLALEGKGGNVTIIPAPDLRLYRWMDEGDSNEDVIMLQAENLARKYLAGSGQKKRVIRAVGFHAVELSGLVSEIKWDQAQLTTEITINSWWSPLSRGVSEWVRNQINPEKFPQESKTRQAKIANGESGSIQPVVPLGNVALPAANNLVKMRVKVIGNNDLFCRTWDGVSEGITDILVAKPRELRHVLANYPQLTALTTVNSQTVTAVSGSTSETWRVTPDYVINGEIFAALTTDGYEDVNLSGRAWAVEADA